MKKIVAWSAIGSLIALIIIWAFRVWVLPSFHPALPSHSFYSFIITTSKANIPCLQAEVEGISFLAKLDMGYDGVLSLPKKILEQLVHKCDSGTVFYGSIKGNKYETPLFTIPKLSIGDLSFISLPVEESHLQFEQDTNLGSSTDFDPSEIMARIGWRAFLGTVVLMDLNHSKFICCDRIETLKEKGFLEKGCVSTDFLSDRGLIEFEAVIGNQRTKCILDTGCTVNLIFSNKEPGFAHIDLSHPLSSTPFTIGKHQLGSCTFYETELPFGVEAVIGMDFLKRGIVCLDFVHHKLYLYGYEDCDTPLDETL